MYKKRVENRETGQQHDIPATGFFVAIGHKPNTDFQEHFSKKNNNHNNKILY